MRSFYFALYKNILHFNNTRTPPVEAALIRVTTPSQSQSLYAV